jgi:hypothetical protein
MATTTADVGAIRRHVHVTQHARSYPLLVIGALMTNYGAVNFAAHPVSWKYGAPLAFVIIWGLSKLNEAKTGVGTGRADYLVAAGFVFVASTAVTIFPFNSSLRIESLMGVWVAIVGLALLAIAFVSRDLVLVAGGLIVTGTGVVTGLLSDGHAHQMYGEGSRFLPQFWTAEWIAIVGIAVAIFGLALYMRERRVA